MYRVALLFITWSHIYFGVPKCLILNSRFIDCRVTVLVMSNHLHCPSRSFFEVLLPFPVISLAALFCNSCRCLHVLLFPPQSWIAYSIFPINMPLTKYLMVSSVQFDLSVSSAQILFDSSLISPFSSLSCVPCRCKLKVRSLLKVTPSSLV